MDSHPWPGLYPGCCNSTLIKPTKHFITDRKWTEPDSQERTSNVKYPHAGSGTSLAEDQFCICISSSHWKKKELSVTVPELCLSIFSSLFSSPCVPILPNTVSQTLSSLSLPGVDLSQVARITEPPGNTISAVNNQINRGNTTEDNCRGLRS